MSIRQATDLEARVRELELLDPTDHRTHRHQAAPPLDTLQGKRAGFLDNRKGNADVILDRVREVLTADYGLAEANLVAKWIYSAPADETILETLAGSCDFVVTAIGD